jgi:putative spermidine/putrescine transport system permease protein
MKAAAGKHVGNLALGTYLLMFFLFLEAPIIIILLASFNAGPTVRFPPVGFSLQWYHELLRIAEDAAGTKPGLVSAVWVSIELGLASMVGAVVAGVLAAYGIERFRFPGRIFLRQAVLLPLLFPQIVTGIGLLLWFSQIGSVPTWVRLVVGHLIITLPYVVVTVSASLQTIDPRLEEAAMNLGANRIATFWFVTIPGIQSGIVSGAIFAWLISFSNFTVTFFLYSGEVTPLPAWLFEYLQYFLDPSIAALSALLLASTFLVLAIANRLFALGRLAGLRK